MHYIYIYTILGNNCIYHRGIFVYSYYLGLVCQQNININEI